MQVVEIAATGTAPFGSAGRIIHLHIRSTMVLARRLDLTVAIRFKNSDSLSFKHIHKDGLR
jgi:hypothetical protein